MITVISRPLGHKLTDAELDATVTSSSGEALFTTLFAHGLVDGQYVFIQSVLESYNGYKIVDQTAYNSFKLKNSENEYVQFKQAVDVLYRISVLEHGYLAITQPIVYELESNLWPVDLSEETYYIPRVVSSQANAEGYTQLNLSTALNSPIAFDFIQLVGDGPLEGAYQILTVLQPWSIIINLAYSASNSFSGYQVMKYYNNYCINVNVWSGLPTDHRWYLEKPYFLLATLRFTPNELGRAKFSISDIIKGYIETRNNLTLDTLPNNLDFMTAFYIEYFESYDVSDGDEITTYEGGAIPDDFEGHAINADMPFKSLYISHMSEYLNEDVYYAKWLVLQSNPVVVIGYYFDLSFINQIEGADILILGNGVLLFTISDPGVGVIRVPIEPTTSGQLCIEAHTDDHIVDVVVNPTPIDLSLMTNEPAGGDLPNWTTGSIPFILGQTQSDNLTFAKVISSGVPFKINYKILIANKTPGIADFQFESLTSLFASVEQVSITANADGLYQGSVTFPATGNAAYITLTFANTPSWDMTLLELSFGDSTTTPTLVPGVQITEPICLTVLEECDSTFIADDDIRLTEDGDFRILE